MCHQFKPGQHLTRDSLSDRNRNGGHKWWSTLKYPGFGSSSSLIPLVSQGGGLVCESVDKADLLSDHFDSKQSS